MAAYIHDLPDWPRFHSNAAALAAPLAAVRHRQGRLTGRMEMLGFSAREQASLTALTEEVVKSSEIEGEVLGVAAVRSSLARRLGIDIGALAASDRHVDGVVEMMLDATQGYERPLTQARLLGWHGSLFPTGWSGLSAIAVGRWRDDHGGPMQVVSGPAGRERVHFQAPVAGRLEAEMAAFLDWFNDEEGVGGAAPDPVIKAAIAHLWFVTIHPLDDGNGRIGRAIADMGLARADGSAQRFYSMSAQIRLEREAYYAVLEETQKSGGLDITAWLAWFLACLDRAFAGAEASLEAVLAKARFWEAHVAAGLNARQTRILNRLLDGFEGKLTTSKWAVMAKTSQDTALRDIDDLVARGILARDPAGGRSTGYSLVR